MRTALRGLFGPVGGRYGLQSYSAGQRGLKLSEALREASMTPRNPKCWHGTCYACACGRKRVRCANRAQSGAWLLHSENAYAIMVPMTRERQKFWLAAGWPPAEAELLAGFDSEESAGFDFRVQAWIDEADRPDAVRRNRELLRESIEIDVEFADEGYSEHVENFRGETEYMTSDDKAERRALKNDLNKMRRYAKKAA